MKPHAIRVCALAVLLPALALALTPSPASAEETSKPPPFKYIGGTEAVFGGCEGNLELSSKVLAFRCGGGTITVPYASITLMEYRPDLSKKVRRAKIRWKVRPDIQTPILGGRRNRYFTVLFSNAGETRALVLRVRPAAIRPYLAEIDLKAGKRVEVESY